MQGYAHFSHEESRGIRSTPPKRGDYLEVLAFGMFGALDAPTEKDVIPDAVTIFYRRRPSTDTDVVPDWMNLATGETHTDDANLEQAISGLKGLGYCDVTTVLPKSLIARRIVRRIP